MPPHRKYSKEMILDAAFDLLCRNGKDALGARELAAELGCSTQPIFSAFGSMDALISELKCKAKELYNEYVQKGLSCGNAFKGVGMSYLAFAKDKPQLFKLLFMGGDHMRGASALEIDSNRDAILESAVKSTGLDRESAQRLYYDVWIFTHGVAVLLAEGTADFTDDELSALLSEAFSGFCLTIRQTEKRNGNDEK